MKHETQVAGITFRTKDDPSVGQLRPTGSVQLVPEPDNKYDPKAIKVMQGDVHLGYIPAKGDTQDFILTELGRGNELISEVKEYKYYNKEAGWNSEHVGQLQAITITIDNGTTEDVYEKDGKTYDRVTVLLGYLNDTGDMDGLLKWAFQYGTYEAYLAAMKVFQDDGIALHKACEDILNGLATSHPVSAAINNFVTKYQPTEIVAEQKVLDENIEVGGTPDVLCTINGVKTLLDWKSGNIRKKHELQTSFYAMNTGCEQVMIVSFKTKNKCGYAVKALNRTQIETNYKAVCHLKYLKDLIIK